MVALKVLGDVADRAVAEKRSPGPSSLSTVVIWYCFWMATVPSLPSTASCQPSASASRPRRASAS